MPAGDVETFHQDGAWHNRIEGEKGTTAPFSTKAEAVTKLAVTKLAVTKLAASNASTSSRTRTVRSASETRTGTIPAT